MKFAKERVGIITQQLKKLSTLQREKLVNWQIKEGCYITPAEADVSCEPWKAFDTDNQHWYGPDKHYWFRNEITVPESFDGKNLWIRIHTGLDDWDDGRNPQFLLFVNGEIVQGLDINHREVLLSECAKGGEKLCLDLQSYTGTLHQEFRLLAHLEERDEKINNLYFDMVVPMWGMNRMGEDDKIRLDLETALTETVNLLDLRIPYSPEFYASMEEAEDYLQREIYEKMGGYDEVIATCIGHTHIDVAWLWTVDQVRQKSCRSFATVLKLMEEFPDYHFMSSQPKLYSFVKERHPEMYEKIRQRVAEGRWEPEGGMWVEADCNLTSGESLTRQFLFGKRFFREEFGVENKILWLPDVFGYSAALPQIMKKCGIDYFMTTKLAWNEFNKVPYDTMQWEGIDGSRIFTHLITTLGVGQDEKDFFTTYNGMLHPDAIMGGWKRYQNKDINQDILVCFGYGDGGGGPTRTMLETSRRMEKGIKGIPKVHQEFSRTYFDRLYDKVKDNKRLPSWIGELYFEYHRGTYTSMARNKRSNRKSEFRMMELELLSVLAQEKGIAYPKQELDKLWEIILTNQFHDILPGSSIREVYDVTREEYQQVDEESNALLLERLEKFVNEAEGYTVWNTLGFVRNDLVLLSGGNVPEAVTDGSHIYPVQKTTDGALVSLKNLPSKGWMNLRDCKWETEEETFAIASDTSGGFELKTPFYEIKVNAEGQFTSLYDLDAKRQVLQNGALGNELRIYEDKPLCYSNWNTDIFHLEKSWSVEQTTKLEWVEQGALRACLLVEKEVLGTPVRQKIYFYRDSRRIDFETWVDWKFSEHLLKVHFPVDIHTDEATYDIQFGNITRKLHTNTSWDVARFEVCGHKWADLSEGAYGVSLMNDCKYGYSMKDRVMSLTLIKSGTDPNAAADQEEHFFTYSLYPHQGDWRQAGTVQESMKLNVPLKVMSGTAAEPRFSFASVDCDNVVLETVKRAEDGGGTIIRLYEVGNCRSQVHLTLAQKPRQAEETNLLEEALEQPVQLTEDGLVFEIKPYEIKTFRIQ